MCSRRDGEAGAGLLALAAAAEALTAAVCKRGAPQQAWDRLLAAVLGELREEGAAAADGALQALTVALHNAASALSSAGGGGGGARLAALLLDAALECSARRCAGALARGGDGSGSAEAAAADDLGRRAKAALTGMLRWASSGGDGEAASAAAAAARAIARVLELLGPRRALQQQQLLQALVKLHVKATLAAGGAGAPARKAGSAGGQGSSTQQILAAGGAAAGEVADALAYAEARCLAQLEANQGAAGAAALRARAAAAAAAAGAAEPPAGWSCEEWDAQAVLVAALCGGCDGACSAEALAAAADALAAAGPVAAAGGAKAKAKGAGRRKAQDEGGGDARAEAPGAAAAAKAAAAALCGLPRGAAARVRGLRGSWGGRSGCAGERASRGGRKQPATAAAAAAAAAAATGVDERSGRPQQGQAACGPRQGRRPQVRWRGCRAAGRRVDRRGRCTVARGPRRL